VAAETAVAAAAAMMVAVADATIPLAGRKFVNSKW